MLSDQTGASEQCAIFFRSISDTSILCQDVSKEFNSTNMIKYLNVIFLRILFYNKLIYLYSTNTTSFLTIIDIILIPVK